MDHGGRMDQRQLWKRHLLKMRREEKRRITSLRVLPRHRPLSDLRRCRSGRSVSRIAHRINLDDKPLLTTLIPEAVLRMLP
jgi:hypothetical protein